MTSAARLVAAVRSAFRGPESVVEDAVVCLLSRGHLLIEDVPGVGKTTLALALGKAIGLTVHRLQFTPDTLPSDIVGLSVYNQKTQSFQFHPGPVFSPILLADEINRATPKAQAALLEAMNDRCVSIDGRTLPLPEPFLVLATQNPVEYLGTYPLPESQLDRFLMRISLGYPAPTRRGASSGPGGAEKALALVRPSWTSRGSCELQRAAEEVTVAEKLLDYVMAIVAATRRPSELRPGRLSPRRAGALPRRAGPRPRRGPLVRHSRRRQAGGPAGPGPPRPLGEPLAHEGRGRPREREAHPEDPRRGEGPALTAARGRGLGEGEAP